MKTEAELVKCWEQGNCNSPHDCYTNDCYLTRDNSPRVRTRQEVEQICLDVVKERLFDYERIKAELDSLNNGDRVVLPKNKEHAKFMLIIAANYLGIKPGESFHYGNN